MHIINSVRGPAAVKSTLEHYQPILNTLNFQEPKGKKLNKVRLLPPVLPPTCREAVQTYRTIVGIVSTVPIVIPVEINVIG